jgi:hypothetical protein
MRGVRRRKFIHSSFKRSSWFLTLAEFLFVLPGAGFICRLMWLAR